MSYAQPPEKEQHFRVDLEPLNHSDFKYPPFKQAELLAYGKCTCGVNPFNPCGQRPDEATQWANAARGAEAVVRYLLSASRESSRVA